MVVGDGGKTRIIEGENEPGIVARVPSPVAPGRLVGVAQSGEQSGLLSRFFDIAEIASVEPIEARARIEQQRSEATFEIFVTLQGGDFALTPRRLEPSPHAFTFDDGGERLIERGVVLDV